MVQLTKCLQTILKTQEYSTTLHSLPTILKQLRNSKKAMVECLNCPGGEWKLNILLSTNEFVQKLNKIHRKKDKPTDILSFPYHFPLRKPGCLPLIKDKEDRRLGDIIISLPYIKKYCDKNDISMESHLIILLAHGICHLLNFDHETENDYKKMRQAERFLLKRYKNYMKKEK